MCEIGKIATLKVIKKVDFGYYVDAGEFGEVLLPNKHAPKEVEFGDELEVFLYLDSDERPIATTQKPKVQVGEVAYLKCNDINKVGAFLDWGLDKDLLVPYSEQHKPFEVDKSYIVVVYRGDHDGRIVASSKVDKYIEDVDDDQLFRPQQQVDLIIANSTELGFKAIINNTHWGVLYENEVFQRLSFGQSKKGFIKFIRPDGKIDLSLQGGKETRDKYSKIVLIYLQKQGGFAPVHDKSDPRLISNLFGMSKKAFKKTIGGLYKERIISIEKDGIRLLDEQQN
ncbi:MAG: GntR family transcriptional regulator [Gammaproteobacteria bacterium]|nr:GntR family transcriptional regulator [Gammaproteobacteria bacterium]